MAALDVPADEQVSSLGYILGVLDECDVDWLVAHGVRRELPDREVVVRVGAPEPSLVLILEGALDVSETPAIPAGPRHRGDAVGVIALLDGGPSPVTATALGACAILEVDQAILRSKLSLDAGFAARLYRAIAAIVVGRRQSVGHGNGLPLPLAGEINTYLAEDRMRRLLARAGRSERVVLTGNDLTIEQVAEVAWRRAPVGVSETARERLVRSREVVERVAAAETPVYGLTTNVGALKEARIADADQPLFQRHILLSHAAGIEPFHDSDVVRAIMLARLNGMARGHAGTQPAVFDALLAMLQAGVHPRVPSRGSIGMADIVPLAHVALPLIGEGEAELDGAVLPGDEAMAAAGIALPTLGPKDGLSLVSANSASVGHGALVLMRCIDLLAAADVAASLSLEALGGHATVLDQRIDTARPFSGQLTAAQQMRMLLEGSSLWTQRPTLDVQDPISFRSAVQVHGAVRDVIAQVRATLETELNSSGDNPIVLADRGEIISDGNFHPAGLSLAFDALAIALAQLTSMAANRVVRLMDPTFTHLAPYLSVHPQLNVGLGVLQKTVTALNGEVRVAANPASLDYVPVAGAIEDHATMAVECVAKAARAVDAAFGVFAIELLVAAQGIDLRGDVVLGTGTGAAYERLRHLVPPLAIDRFQARDIAAVRGALEDGQLLDAVAEAVASPVGATVRPGQANGSIEGLRA